MIGMVADAKFLADDHRDALGRPDLAEEAEGFGAQGEQTRELGELFGGQSRCRARRRLSIQGFDASFASPLQPLAHRALGDA